MSWVGGSTNRWQPRDEPSFWGDFTAEYVQLISDVRRSYGKHVAVFAGYGAMDRGNQEYRAAVQAAVDQANAGSHKFTPGECSNDRLGL